MSCLARGFGSTKFEEGGEKPWCVGKEDEEEKGVDGQS
jgi:hypothetical protein